MHLVTLSDTESHAMEQAFAEHLHRVYAVNSSLYDTLTATQHQCFDDVAFGVAARRALVDFRSAYDSIRSEAAGQMMAIIREFIPQSVMQSGSVTDATGGIGCMTIALTQGFPHVNSVDINRHRSLIIRHNCNLLLPPDVARRVHVYHGDYTLRHDTRHTLRQNVIFFDPPWGGPHYIHTHKLRLEMSGVPMETLVHQTAHEAQFVVLNAPTNFDFVHFTNTVQVTHCILACAPVYCSAHGKHHSKHHCKHQGTRRCHVESYIIVMLSRL